jgi:hypothetical protein
MPSASAASRKRSKLLVTMCGKNYVGQVLVPQILNAAAAAQAQREH